MLLFGLLFKCEFSEYITNTQFELFFWSKDSISTSSLESLTHFYDMDKVNAIVLHRLVDALTIGFVSTFSRELPKVYAVAHICAMKDQFC